MAIYNVTLADGQTFRMEADMSQASAPIAVNFHGEEDTWQHTPYQTADASHSEFIAAKLVAEHYSTGEDDCTEVASVDEVTHAHASVTVTTESGAEITATVDGTTVQISQDGHHAGSGRWDNGHGGYSPGHITDCSARLGAKDGSETDDAYDALDEALQESLGERESIAA